MIKSCICLLILSLLLYDVAARRRSARLIESPWVYNWPKKAPIYINIDSDNSILVDRRTKTMNKKGIEQVNTLQYGRGATSGSNNVVQIGSLDIRSEWGMGKVSDGNVFKDDDDNFVTPYEHFGKSKSIQLQGNGEKNKKAKFVGLVKEEVG